MVLQSVAGQTDEAHRAVESVTVEWVKATASKDLPALLDLVTDDVAFLPAEGQVIRGKQGVRQMFERLFSQFGVRQESRIEEVRIGGAWAFSWGTEIPTLKPTAGGEPVRMVGRGLTVLRRSEDGRWRFVCAINNVAPQRQAPQAGGLTKEP